MVKKPCQQCGNEFTGFGSACKKCRKARLNSLGNITQCSVCGSFFTGFGQVCPECPGSTPVDRIRETLYLNPVCPYAHRAAFTAALCLRDINVVLVPLATQLTFADKVGMEAVPCGASFPNMTVQDLKARRAEFTKKINSSGAVPALKADDDSIIIESEIVSEFLDFSTGVGLVPKDPILKARVRLATKSFTDSVPSLHALLANQDPKKDARIAESIKEKLAAFAACIEPSTDYSFLETPTYVDAHCGPFLYRYNILLPHFRGFNLFEGYTGCDRLRNLLGKIQILTSFQKVQPVTATEIISAYEMYAYGNKWADRPTKEKLFAGGRGISTMGG